MQAVKAELPAVESELDGHAMHVESAAAPTDVEYLPETQFVHVSDPAGVLNFPATHCVQVLPSDPVEPGLQVQAAKAEVPAGASEYDGQTKHVESEIAPIAAEYVPAIQSAQCADPIELLYFPATHSVQSPPTLLLPIPPPHTQHISDASEPKLE